jgi:hypothetical protein
MISNLIYIVGIIATLLVGVTIGVAGERWRVQRSLTGKDPGDTAQLAAEFFGHTERHYGDRIRVERDDFGYFGHPR